MNRMTFSQARKKLDKIAGETYHSMRFDLTTRFNKYKNQTEYETVVSVYIDGYNHYSGNYWEEAFDKLEKAMAEPKDKPCEAVPIGLKEINTEGFVGKTPIV